MEMQQDGGRIVRPGAVAAGGVLLMLGVAMLLDPTGMAAIHPGRLVGPVVLILIGTSILFGRGRCARVGHDVTDMGRRSGRGRNRSIGGLWLIGLGGWMLVSQTHLFGLSFATSWPLILVLMGLLMVMRGLR